MRILLVLGRYLPEKSGGIEIYTHFLATLLSKNGQNVEVAILNNGKMIPYIFEGVQVIPLEHGFESFANLLKNGSYDVCHFQELSAFGGVELFWFREAKKYCKKIFFTFHLPYLTCYKNDFRYKGIENCNHFTSPERCVECIIATRLHYSPNDNFNLHNSIINVVSPLLKKTSKIQNLKSNIAGKNKELQELIQICDELFIYGKWFKKLLNKNGYHSDKLKIIPHISKPDIDSKVRDYSIKKKLLFVGRIEKAKGLHLLTQAMNTICTTNLHLDVAGNIVDEKYFNDCKERYSFTYKGVLPRENLLKSFRFYDFLVLPSAFTEMNSLALKEAFYEHLPVIVSSAKGNKDVVDEAVNGFIFDYNNAMHLAAKIDKGYELLSTGWKPKFTMEETAEKTNQEILSYYSL